MFPMAKWHVLRRGTDKLVFDAGPFLGAHVREAQRVEHLGILVVPLVAMCRGRCARQESACRNERPIGEREVLLGLAHDSDWKRVIY